MSRTIDKLYQDADWLAEGFLIANWIWDPGDDNAGFLDMFAAAAKTGFLHSAGLTDLRNPYIVHQVVYGQSRRALREYNANSRAYPSTDRDRSGHRSAELHLPGRTREA